MDLQRLDLNLLVVLDVLLDERSVSRAAQRLNLSQPATSAALSRLRSVLQDRLLVRGRGEMFLTSRASALRAPLKNALHGLSGALAAKPASTPTDFDTNFNLVMTDYASFVLAPLILQRMIAEAPHATLEVLPLERPRVFEWLRIGIAHAAVVVPDRIPKGLLSEPLFEDQHVVVASPNHPLSRSRQISLEELLNCPFVDFTAGREILLPVYQRFRTRVQGWRPVASVPQFLMMLPIIRNGGFVAIMGSRAATALVGQGLLTVLDVEEHLPKFSFHLAWHQRIDGLPEQTWLRSVAREAGAGTAAASLQSKLGL